MKNSAKIIIIILAVLLVTGAVFVLGKNFKGPKVVVKLETPRIMKIISPVFANNAHLPAKYTCDGENINPPLQIGAVPAGTQSLVLIVDDPDAPGGTFLHWLVWNISPDIAVIEENSLPAGSVQGKNNFGKNNYGGPCPPSGTHRFFFKVYALNKKLALPAGSSLKQVQAAIQGYILDEAEIVGLYQRK